MWLLSAENEGQELDPFEFANVAYCYSVHRKTIDNTPSVRLLHEQLSLFL